MLQSKGNEMEVQGGALLCFLHARKPPLVLRWCILLVNADCQVTRLSFLPLCNRMERSADWRILLPTCDVLCILKAFNCMRACNYHASICINVPCVIPYVLDLYHREKRTTHLLYALRSEKGFNRNYLPNAAGLAYHTRPYIMPVYSRTFAFNTSTKLALCLLKPSLLQPNA